jgi:Arc/MetJ-type ribon-helix-helix transcriptional regulator
MSDKTRIQVRVREEIKEDWIDRVENDDNLQSMSHLVRVAVQDYLQQETKKEARKNEEIVDAVEYVIDQQLDIRDGLQEIKERQVTQDDIDALQSQIDNIEQ